MSAWGVGPFDNDDAADFAGDLDDAPAHARIEMIGAILERVADNTRFSNAPRAVVAAALVASQCPGGAPVDPVFAPRTPVPPLPAHLRELAIQALDNVLTTWLAEAWDESPRGPEWRRTVADLRRVLDPPQDEVLFAL